MTPLAMLIGGLLGSGHCIGMCGGFALSIGALRPGLAQTLPLQLIYTAGRITTYAFIGALAGGAGSRILAALPLVVAQRSIAIASGAIMLCAGAAALGLLHTRPGSRIGLLLAPLFRHFLNRRGLSGAYVAGVFTGFLPCGLVYAFAALALNAGDALGGLVGMACFGLGTAPVMIAIGCGASWMGTRLRTHAHRLAACFVIILGLATIWRALPGDHCARDAATAGAPADVAPSCHQG